MGAGDVVLPQPLDHQMPLEGIKSRAVFHSEDPDRMILGVQVLKEVKQAGTTSSEPLEEQQSAAASLRPLLLWMWG